MRRISLYIASRRRNLTELIAVSAKSLFLRYISISIAGVVCFSMTSWREIRYANVSYTNKLFLEFTAPIPEGGSIVRSLSLSSLQIRRIYFYDANQFFLGFISEWKAGAVLSVSIDSGHPSTLYIILDRRGDSAIYLKNVLYLDGKTKIPEFRQKAAVCLETQRN